MDKYKINLKINNKIENIDLFDFEKSNRSNEINKMIGIIKYISTRLKDVITYCQLPYNKIVNVINKINKQIKKCESIKLLLDSYNTNKYGEIWLKNHEQIFMILTLADVNSNIDDILLDYGCESNNFKRSVSFKYLKCIQKNISELIKLVGIGLDLNISEY